MTSAGRLHEAIRTAMELVAEPSPSVAWAIETIVKAAEEYARDTMPRNVDAAVVRARITEIRAELEGVRR